MLALDQGGVVGDVESLIVQLVVWCERIKSNRCIRLVVSENINSRDHCCSVFSVFDLLVACYQELIRNIIFQV